MLGPVDLREVVTRSDRLLTEAIDALLGELSCVTGHGSGRTDRCARLDWIICGGESGPKARPMHPDWSRSLRDQCAAAGVPFLFKQWGEFAPNKRTMSEVAASPIKPTPVPLRLEGSPFPAALMDHVGKKAAGRLLDGVEHNGFPTVAADLIAADEARAAHRKPS